MSNGTGCDGNTASIPHEELLQPQPTNESSNSNPPPSTNHWFCITQQHPTLHKERTSNKDQSHAFKIISKKDGLCHITVVDILANALTQVRLRLRVRVQVQLLLEEEDLRLAMRPLDSNRRRNSNMSLTKTTITTVSTNMTTDTRKIMAPRHRR